VFTRFNCELVATQNISIVALPQIGEIARGAWEPSKLGGTKPTWLFPIEVFT
jgi:hypothetical protein